MHRLALLLLFAGCSSALAADAKPADLIVYGARVVTNDAKFHIAKAIAVHDGRIALVGDDKEVLALKGAKPR